MKNYLLSENLKHKNSFLKKLILIAPIATVLLSFILMPFYFTVNAYNWWYVILMPAIFALIPGLMHLKEEKKLKYRAVFPLDINLKKIWIAKIVMALIFLTVAELLHMVGVAVFQQFVNNQLTGNYKLSTLIIASLILLITNIWQIPFCFFLAKKLGFISSIVINAILGLGLGILISDSTMWIYCPYSWGIRSMVPIMSILPNGEIASLSSTLISNTSLVVPCVLSAILFITLTIMTSNWFSKLEVK